MRKADPHTKVGLFTGAVTLTSYQPMLTPAIFGRADGKANGPGPH